MIANCIPILIPRGYWKNDTASSASEVIRTLYAVPADSGDVLRGQMENGNLIFLIEGVEESDDGGEAVLLEMTKLRRSNVYPGCFFLLLSLNSSEAIAASTLPRYQTRVRVTGADGP